MDTTRFLDHLLASARDLAADTRDHIGQASDRLQGGGIAGLRLDRTSQGLLAGGALALLLGSRSGRRLARLGGLTALGTLAYRTYRQYQAPADAASTGITATSQASLPPAAAITAEQRSRAILAGLIAAAKADGHIDPRQRELIHAEIAQLAPDAAVLAWFEQQLEAPMDAGALAALASTPELSAEVYLASVLIIDPDNPAERQWLDMLAAALGLDPVLRRSLDQQPG